MTAARLPTPPKSTPAPIDVTILKAARLAAQRVRPRHSATAEARAALCLTLLRDAAHPALASFKELISSLPIDERHYWVGTLYTLLLPPKVRREQAAYFTPPLVAEAVLSLVIEAGFDPARHSVLDPAAGGAAFLSTIAGRKLALGIAPAEAAKQLHGYELDAGLAEISIGLISDRLGTKASRKLITVRDALTAVARPVYGLVVANPPYGRITPDDLSDIRWQKVAQSGHINKYAVFADLALRSAAPGGFVALVIPSSFRAGPYYDRLRFHLRSQAQILSIGTIASRDGMFADVAQDISVLIMRKGAPHDASRPVAFPVVPPQPNLTVRTAKLPADAKKPWPTPVAADRHVGGATLADYDVEVRTGYFVWNREKSRLVESNPGNAYPLIWAKNVKAGCLCSPAGKHGEQIDFVTFANKSTAIIRSPAAVLQRTTNDLQSRRLVAAVVDPAVTKEWGGFVTENHTIALIGKSQARLRLVVALLNTKAVDDRYRKVSGTAAISVTLLRGLDLPLPDRFQAALESSGDAEAAAKLAYSNAALPKVPK